MAIVMFCSHCGAPVASETEVFCHNCGAPLHAEAPIPPQGAGQQMPPYGYVPPVPFVPPVSYENAETLLKVLCFFVPLAGIILYCLDKDKKPVAAKQCLNMSIISIVVCVVVPIVIWILIAIAAVFSTAILY